MREKFAWRIRGFTYFVLVSPVLAMTSCVSSGSRELLAERERQFYDVKVSPSPSSIEEESTSPTISNIPDSGDVLQAYLHLAIQQNAGLRASFDRWKAAMEQIPQATALPDPQFTWIHFVEEIQTRTGPQENRFTLSQKFPWFGKLKLQGEAKALAAESIWWEVDAKKLAVLRDVKNAYYEYAYLGRAIQILEANLKLLKSLEPVVQRSIQVGGGQGDLIRLQVEIGKLENELASLRDFRTPISAHLRAAVNLEGSDPLPWPTLEEEEVRTYEQEAIRNTFNQLNPELRSLFQKIEQMESQAKRARLDGYPDITLGVTYMDTDDAGPLPAPPPSMGSMGQPNPSPPPRFPEGSGDDPWGITLGFNLPIWRQKYRAGVREAKSMQDMYENQLTQRRFDLLAQIDLKTYELDDSVRQINLYRQTLIPRAQQALELTEISYESANATFLDVIDAQRELLAFERAYWRFVATQRQRVADLEMLCGGPLP